MGRSRAHGAEAAGHADIGEGGGYSRERKQEVQRP